jgi:hypothetical protein
MSFSGGGSVLSVEIHFPPLTGLGVTLHSLLEMDAGTNWDMIPEVSKELSLVCLINHEVNGCYFCRSMRLSIEYIIIDDDDSKV